MSSTWHSVVVMTSADQVELVADTLWRWDPPAVEERTTAEGVVVLAGYPTAAEADAAAAAVRAAGLGEARVAPVADDGLDGWRAHAQIVLAGPFALVPAWTDQVPPPGRQAIYLDPGPTFGSGSHPTTRLVLVRLASTVGPGDRVLDVGCGSGVLAVAAAMSGARAVGIDIDPASGDVTEANARRNQVADRVRFDPRPLGELARECRSGAPRYPVVVANLLAPVVAELAPDLVDVLDRADPERGFLVVSGLLSDRWEAGVEPLVGPPGDTGALRVVAVDHLDGWAAVTLGAGVSVSGRGRHPL